MRYFRASSMVSSKAFTCWRLKVGHTCEKSCEGERERERREDGEEESE
jgi:hypothetical protein